ncbi:membrane protein [Kaistia sp. 32K]|uniref:heparan-alpha-glucosaminide N-acetyltransferase n=1 Tax=Kaistia sp. 32K TaxID=2795690 RepID=UPI001914DACB|nr:heparan-alpha-glucosaminide N-acetyltransferase [Kaistia sp. 32K]BCP55974.1 membrane protein [Kaistia sp. 32K]
MNEAAATAVEAQPGAPATAARSSRIAALDVARGVALVCMAIFHGAWDVAFLHLVRFDPGASIGWIVFARAIAGSFLMLVGISLVLSVRNGFRLRPYLTRLAMIVAAAALVSLATYFVMPEGWIFFGILHQIALASVLGLLFLRLPPRGIFLAAVAVFALPFFFRSAIFAQPALWWVGLAPKPPASFDYVPLFPWFGVVLFGMAAAKLGVALGWDKWLAGWQPRFAPARWLAFGGRHSLAVYLIHQPILYAIFFGLAAVFAPNAAENDARADCVERCVAIGKSEADCQTYCGCVFGDLKDKKLTAPFLARTLNDDQTTRLQETIAVCSATTFPPVDETPDAAPQQP